MKRLSVLVLTLFANLAPAATPVGPMNYQGRLLDDNGIPVTGSYNFVIRIFDDPTAGTLKYREVYNSTTVDDGVYSFKIGIGPKAGGDSEWDIDLWQNNLNDLYLELVVNGETLSPRHELTSAPHAFTSTLALSAGALGNKTAAEYDNILQGVCVSSKGKWLELVQKCLGAGSSFPGPTQVDWNTLTASSNFRNLDLSQADISGINFGAAGGANLRGTNFTETTYSVAGLSGANLSKTTWDGAIATDSVAVNLDTSTNLVDATFKSMDMSKWNFTWLGAYTSQYTGFSAAYLSVCPAAVFTGWECRLMRGPSSPYFLAGSYANLSSSSAAAITIDGVPTLDIRSNGFDNLSTSYASFVGVKLTQQFTNGSFYFADLSNATLKNIRFSGTNFAGAKFIGTTMEDVVFASGMVINVNDFSASRLNRVNFESNVSTPDFTKASLRQVDFTNLGGANFTSASLEDVRIHTSLYANASPYDTKFIDTNVYGDFYVASINSQQYFTMQNVSFLGSKLSGALTDLTFTGTIAFKNVIFKNLDICSTVFPLVDTSAPHDDLVSVKWEGPVECPNGEDVNGGTGINTCDYQTRMTQTAVANCTAGIP